MTIHQAIPAIMRELGSVGKDRKNTQQNYSFRGIDDVYNAVNPLLSKYGVFTVPELITERREERQTKTGGTLIYTIATFKYHFYAEDGSEVVATVIGEGMDSGDKSANKAMSAAQKYAFLQIFAIPTEEAKDSEIDSHEVLPKKQNVNIPAPPKSTPKVETPNVPIHKPLQSERVLEIFQEPVNEKLRYEDDKLPIGKNKGRRFRDIVPKDLQGSVAWMKEHNESGKWTETIQHAEEYLTDSGMPF
jgi:hypothetical protein